MREAFRPFRTLFCFRGFFSIAKNQDGQEGALENHKFAQNVTVNVFSQHSIKEHGNVEIQYCRHFQSDKHKATTLLIFDPPQNDKKLPRVIG